MKLAIFRASGRTGVEIIKLALEKEHMVTAFVRDPKRLITDLILKELDENKWIGKAVTITN